MQLYEAAAAEKSPSTVENIPGPEGAVDSVVIVSLSSTIV